LEGFWIWNHTFDCLFDFGNVWNWKGLWKGRALNDLQVYKELGNLDLEGLALPWVGLILFYIGYDFEALRESYMGFWVFYKEHRIKRFHYSRTCHKDVHRL
jgi:hypothetical protein